MHDTPRRVQARIAKGGASELALRVTLGSGVKLTHAMCVSHGSNKIERLLTASVHEHSGHACHKGVV